MLAMVATTVAATRLPRRTGLALTAAAGAVCLAVVAGALIGALGRLSGRLHRHQPFAFGPFLALGTVAVWVLGEPFWMAVAGFSAGV